MTVEVNIFRTEDNIKERSPVEIPKVKKVTLDYTQTNSRSAFERPEYDLAELITIEDVESYVRQTHRKKVGLAFKEGWDIVGKNLDTLDYIKKRLYQLEHAQNKPWRLLIKELFNDIVSKSNAFLVKVRNPDISGGFIRKEGNKTLDPVAAYFIMPAETVEIAKDNNGKITKIRQVMDDGRTREYRPDNVVHFYLDKKTGFSMGTPLLTPVKDDIRTLRRIEENIDLLVYQNLFPLFQYKVGTDKMPAQYYADGTSEIDVVRTEIEYMPPEGILVTPERHEISMVGSEGRALRAEGYLKHFKERVFAGLGTSSVDMGEGGTSNRNTADRLSDNLRDDVKAIQDDFEAQFDFFIIRELLLEGQFGNSILEPENAVHLKFKEIDVERQIKIENHNAQMYSQHAITEDEMRIRIGLDPIELEDRETRDKMYLSLVEIPVSLIKAVDENSGLGAAVDNPNLPINEGNAKAGEARQTRLAKVAAVAKQNRQAYQAASRGTRSGASQNRPSNQHGTRTGPKMRRDFVDNELKGYLDDLLHDVQYYIKLGESKDWIKKIVLGWTNHTKKRHARIVTKSFYDGFRSLGLNPFDYDITSEAMTVEKHSDLYIGKLGRNLEDRFSRLDGTEDKSTMMSIMDITLNRINAINESEQQRAYNYGRLIAFRLTGNKVKTISNKDACEACVNTSLSTSDPNRLSIDDIPPTHSFCTCQIDKD